MKTSLTLLTGLMALLLISSFTVKPAHSIIGTYGVSDSDPSQIKLVLHSDHTFYYQDLSRADRKIIVNGNWTSKGSKYYLNDKDSKTSFHEVWTLSENGKVAKSRKGLSFYRLCKID